MIHCNLLTSTLILLLLSNHSAAEDPRWPLVHTIPAAEAHQAAAATQQHFYAISSTVVARYDRETGARLEVSSGEAKHLNSGFLWNDRLLLAHSNYPAVPEQSQVMQLNLQTMRLSVFHDFRDYGGSLTWVIRHKNEWWCNFARYDEHNAETFLVSFDDNWNELGRWTFPPEVISQLGRYSLSGGLWYDDSLLTTDHDNGRIYRLQLPAAGSVLKFIGSEQVPFTGQGFAVDPLTGGLIGISRKEQQIRLTGPRLPAID